MPASPASFTRPERLSPSAIEEAAAMLAAASAEGRRVRIRGGGTKGAWRGAPAEPALVLSSAGLAGIVEHNAGDLTLTVGAGTPLATVQAALAGAGQMLALDPPGEGATIGGILATADSGPWRHRYGAIRDLVLGVTVVLSDGTVARAGGRVIKNVAGYDLGKLFCGSMGTLGLVARVSLRLHPRPLRTATARARSTRPAVLARAASALAAAPLEADALDMCWDGATGAVLVRFSGRDPAPRLARAGHLMNDTGAAMDLVEEDDAALWQAQRDGQRAATDRMTLRVAALPSRLVDVCAAASALGGTVVGRAGLGTFFVTLPADAGAVCEVRARLAPHPVVVTDAPAEVHEKAQPWVSPSDALLRRVKARFDPAGTLW